MLIRRIRTALLALTLALPTPVNLPGAVPLLRAASVAVVGGGIVLSPEAAEAQRRSGGYSRPSSGGYSRPSAPRTPSFGSPSPSRPSSGGYSRPSGGGGFTAPSAPLGGGDRSLSRRSGGESLDRYREAQRPPAPAPAPTPAPSGGGWGTGGGGWGTGWGGQRRSGGDTYGYGARRSWPGGWTTPGWAYRSRPSFGVWDGLFLWFLLDNLTRPGYADWFHHHQNDPGYAQWRTEAERMAAEDPELRRKLAELDQRLAQQQGAPRDPAYLPPGTTPELAQADPAAADEADDPGLLGGSIGFLLLLGGGLVIFVVLSGRFRRNARNPGTAQRGGTMGRLDTAADMLRRKVTGERYEPSLFRVGMTVTYDPTPFILAGTATKVTPPSGQGTDSLVSVTAVGTLASGATRLHRLYLGDDGFFQLHLDAAGQPEECRWFSRLDEINPGTPEEWAFWLDRTEGMVGWPQFETKDGKLYDRRWSPGASRVPPVDFDESVVDHRGTRRRRLSAMLYAAPTGAADPAPATEYVLVSTVEDQGQAWVEVWAGIDVNPATLSLA